MQVRIVETPEEKRKVFVFRYGIYVEALKMRVNADHAAKELRDELDDVATSIAVLEDEEILGSLRLLLLRDVTDTGPLVQKYRMAPAIKALGLGPKSVSITSRFVLDPRLKDGQAIFGLLRIAYDTAVKRGARVCYDDVSPHLLPFYEQLGYRRYTSGYNDTEYGYKIPVMMLTRDHEHFRKVRSPLARYAEKYDDDEEARDWFATSYPAFVGQQTASLIAAGAFFDLLAERISSDPLHSVSLLRDLTREQADRFLTRATLLKLYAGDHIIREGTIDNTLYVLLSGLAEVRGKGEGEGRGASLGMIGAGDTFGEIGFLTPVPRTADVVATTYCEVLVLSGKFLEQLVIAEPDIGARVLLNLSRELAGRLLTTNQRVAQAG